MCISEVTSGSYSPEIKPEPSSDEIYVVSGGVVDPPWDPPQTSESHLHPNTQNNRKLE